MHSVGLPIWKASLDLCIYIDMIVKNQDRYYRYSIGTEMRECSREMFYLVGHANRASKQERIAYLQTLVGRAEELKQMILLAKELKAFKSFKFFEHSSISWCETEY